VALGLLPGAHTWRLSPTSVLSTRGDGASCLGAGHSAVHTWRLGCTGRDSCPRSTWGPLALGY